MATILDKDKQNLNQNNSNNLAQPPALAGGQPAQATAAPTTPNQPASSGRFTNVQKYIRANNPNQFAGQVGQKIVGRGENVKQNLGQASQQFQGQSEAGRVDTEQNRQLANQLTGGAQGLNDQSISGIANILGSQGYAGPQGLQNAGRLQSQAAAAQRLGQMGSTAPGRSQLLSQMYNRPSYSEGQKSFDNLLLNQDKTKALQSARLKTAGLQQLAGQTEQTAEQRAQNLADQSKNFIQNAQGQYENAVGETVGSVEQRAREASAQRQNNLNDIKNRWGRGQMTGDELSNLGLSHDEMLYVNPTQYLKSGPTDLSASQVASQQQIQNLTNLQKIAQQAAGKYNSQNAGNINNILQGPELGNYSTDLMKGLYGVDTAGFKNAQTEGQKSYQAASNDINNLKSQQSTLSSQYGFDNPENLQQAKATLDVLNQNGGKLPGKADPQAQQHAREMADAYAKYASTSQALADKQKNFNNTYNLIRTR